MKNLILAALVIFCTQPISSMNSDRKGLPAILSAIGPAKEEAPKGDGWECETKRRKVDQKDLHRQQKLNTALLDAIKRDSLSKVISCLEQGADANARDLPNITSYGADLGSTPALHYATNKDAYKICELLLAHGAHPDAKDGRGSPALLECMYNNYANSENYIKMFLAYGADANIQNARGVTLLMTVTRRGYLSQCKLLLKYGADPELKCTRGMKALDYAHETARHNPYDIKTDDIPNTIKLLSDPEEIRAAILHTDNPLLQKKCGTFKNMYHAIQNRESDLK